MAVVIDNHLPREPLISSYGDWPLPPCIYIPLESEMALWKEHLSFDVSFTCSILTCCGVCDLRVWRSKCFWSNLVHCYKRYSGKWVITCIRAFDIGNDFPVNQVTCHSGFGFAEHEHQILFPDLKWIHGSSGVTEHDIVTVLPLRRSVFETLTGTELAGGIPCAMSTFTFKGWIEISKNVKNWPRV